MDHNLSGKTLFITGGSRGIGRAIALRAARDGANIVIAAKTQTAHQHLPGTIFSVAEEVEAAGGRALPLVVDVRDEASIANAVELAVEHFGGIDACINNASAISPTGTLETPAKRYDLMHQINVRGAFLVTQHCLPHLLKAANPHVINLSPPINLDPAWLGPHVAYTTSKYMMSLWVLGMAKEFAGKVGFNALWPISTIDTSAVRFVLGGEGMARHSRTADIMADAAYEILVRDSQRFSGNLLIDELVLRDAGVTDFEQYAVVPGEPLYPDMFVAPNVLAQSSAVFLEEPSA
ncbi:SDR family oxidoreductase [Pseudomonas sp. NFX224]|uniref:SDR family oxidoreductase n=1 Tax=Pseudomonas sp. NFX224 TaxID=3402862 RepID=UPI003AFB7C8C